MHYRFHRISSSTLFLGVRFDQSKIMVELETALGMGKGSQINIENRWTWFGGFDSDKYENGFRWPESATGEAKR